ncbi:hypothetical protein QYE76_062142 [Lolium multiflorum]|uniref:F-box domain-containing protein n=1 Tax=Lolium multiflorum TaxID=4521 RepID=A0AAD8S545_LOLMU|nr:hypothetical protein QYE76_062142 [Lolium multiflorum]
MAAPLRRTATATNRDNRSTGPAISTANGSVLPQDLLYEILVRIPAKQLCRLGAVCRSWRSLLSDSSFVAAHSARHGPLIAALKQQPVGVDILDVSGHTVRQIRLQDYPQNHYGNVACTNLDLFCFIGAGRRPHVINPATGVVSLMPHDSDIDHKSPSTMFAIGRASLTGKAKVLAVATRYSTCKVLTLGGADEWRETDTKTIQCRSRSLDYLLPDGQAPSLRPSIASRASVRLAQCAIASSCKHCSSLAFAGSSLRVSKDSTIALCSTALSSDVGASGSSEDQDISESDRLRRATAVALRRPPHGPLSSASSSARAGATRPGRVEEAVGVVVIVELLLGARGRGGGWEVKVEVEARPGRSAAEMV